MRLDIDIDTDIDTDTVNAVEMTGRDQPRCAHRLTGPTDRGPLCGDRVTGPIEDISLRAFCPKVPGLRTLVLMQWTND